MTISQSQSEKTPVVSLDDLKCPVCGKTLRSEGRHVSGPWDGPATKTTVTLYLVCTCIAEEGFELGGKRVTKEKQNEE